MSEWSRVGRAAPSGEEKFDLPEEIAWFGDILNIDGSLVDIGPRSFFVNQVVGGRQYYLGKEDDHVGQAFQPDRLIPSGWKA